MVSWARPSYPPKRNLDWFCHVYSAHELDQQTHRHTDYATPSVGISRIARIAIAAMRPDNNNNNNNVPVPATVHSSPTGECGRLLKHF